MLKKIEKFKSILHKKHIKFSDKYFDLTNNFNVFSDFPSDEPEHDQIKQSTEQLKKIEISPASFLEEERLFRLKTSSHTKENHTQNIGYMDSPTLKLNALKQLPKNYLDTTYERNPKNSNKIKMKENFDLFPMNISKQPITENLNWFKYNNKTSDFYDKNIQTYTVTSHNNNISGKTLQKYSKKNFYLNEEIVHLTPAKNRKHPIPKSSQKNFCYYIEEQHLNEFHQMGFKKQLKPAFNEEDLLENKPLSPHKRSVSLAAPLKKDSIIVDDLSGYSIPKFKEIQQNEKKLNNLFPNNKKKQDWNEILSKSALDKNKKAEKRSYMIYSINDPNHLKNKDNQIIDCLVYDFDRKTKENNFDLKKKVKKNIFDPM